MASPSTIEETQQQNQEEQVQQVEQTEQIEAETPLNPNDKTQQTEPLRLPTQEVLEALLSYFKPSVKVNDKDAIGADVGVGPFEAGAHLRSLSAYSRAGPFSSEVSASEMRVKANVGDNGIYAAWTENGPRIGIYSPKLGYECPPEFKKPIVHEGKGTGKDILQEGLKRAAQRATERRAEKAQK